jgi:hypothetical protein
MAAASPPARRVELFKQLVREVVTIKVEKRHGNESAMQSALAVGRQSEPASVTMQTAGGLQGSLPQPRSAATATAIVGGDQEVRRLSKPDTGSSWPTTVGSCRGEPGCIVCDANSHLSLVVSQIVDSVGNRLPHVLVREIVRMHFLWMTPSTVLAATVLEISD